MKSRGFDAWLRNQLEVKQLTQRQLAKLAGVDHSTISRLLRNQRRPTLHTAVRIARGLREIGANEGPWAVVSGSFPNPAARVEAALAADEALDVSQVRQVMAYYLSVRAHHVTPPRPPDARRSPSPSPSLMPPIGHARTVSPACESMNRASPG